MVYSRLSPNHMDSREHLLEQFANKQGRTYYSQTPTVVPVPRTRRRRPHVVPLAAAALTEPEVDTLVRLAPITDQPFFAKYMRLLLVSTTTSTASSGSGSGSSTTSARGSSTGIGIGMVAGDAGKSYPSFLLEDDEATEWNTQEGEGEGEDGQHSEHYVPIHSISSSMGANGNDPIMDELGTGVKNVRIIAPPSAPLQASTPTSTPSNFFYNPAAAAHNMERDAIYPPPPQDQQITNNCSSSNNDAVNNFA
mmetsp:Transcript_5180/g.8461  ORF Transcript_5180/g.8461 Transcript_5180/m.8461 type:complete len:251 (+) Transcript_5180:449-1201(+)